VTNDDEIPLAVQMRMWEEDEMRKMQEEGIRSPFTQWRTRNDDVPDEGLRRVAWKVDSFCVDLSEQAVMLRNDTAMAIAGKELGAIGREWLRLLSLQYWAKKAGSRYVVPRNFSSDDAINNALPILEHLTDDELTAYMEDQMPGEDEARETEDRGIRQEKIAQIKRVLTNVRSIDWTCEQVAEAVGLSVEELMDLMDSVEFVLGDAKPLNWTF
jgi:hypothetical protein